jgi:hypothetical protein
MTMQNPVHRRRARTAALLGALLSAVLLVFTTWSVFTAYAAGTNAGDAQVVDPNGGQPLTSGGSSTAFTLQLPSQAACTGDSTNSGYRVQSYMVPSTVDPGTLQFGNAGPTPTATGANFREPLFDTSTNPYVNAQTANQTSPNGPGPIINIPSFNFAVFSPGDIPPNTYNVGIACTKGPPSTTQQDKYWNVELTFTTDPQDSPAQIHWVVTPTATTTTTASSTTTTTTGATTTTTSGGTTTTTTGGTTTTTSGSTTTTTTPVACGGTASGQLTVTNAAGNTMTPGSTLNLGQQITASGTGFVPGETTTVTACSSPVTVTTAVADNTGKVTAAITIPTTLDPGTHTLAITGATHSATFSFNIAASSNGSSGGTGSAASGGGGTSSSSTPLALTGADPLKMVFWALLLVIFGWLAVDFGQPLEGENRR